MKPNANKHAYGVKHGSKFSRVKQQYGHKYMSGIRVQQQQMLNGREQQEGRQRTRRAR